MSTITEQQIAELNGNMQRIGKIVNDDDSYLTDNQDGGRTVKTWPKLADEFADQLTQQASDFSGQLGTQGSEFAAQLSTQENEFNDQLSGQASEFNTQITTQGDTIKGFADAAEAVGIQVAADAARVSGDAVQVSNDKAAAEAAKNQAVLASEGSGVAAFYDTFADADADKANLAEGDVVRIFSDETKFFDPTTRRLEAGELVFKTSAVTDESFLFEFFNHNEFIDFQINIPDNTGVFEFSLSTTGGNVVIDWGDGSTDEVGGSLTEYSHTYASSGGYRITVGGIGQVDSLSFFNGTGNLVTRMNSFGRYNISLFRLFFLQDLSGLVDFTNNPVITRNVTNLASAFNNTSFNLPIGNLETPNVENTSDMFRSNFVFNQPIEHLDTSKVKVSDRMFQSAVKFNQPLGRLDMSSNENATAMLQGAVDFDQNLGNWDISSMKNLSNFLLGVTLSTVNYDALLIGWSPQAVQDNVVFHGGNSQYTLGGAAEAARASLINDHGWIITDGGGI